ncbi:hypothetical protein QYF36_007412 [Acer negundo]|nr:hypothetical protein QYF36_007412 [Acer negundo]
MGKKNKKKKKTQDNKLDPACNTRNTKNLIAEVNMNTKDDLVSHLPDDILHCIISLLPYKSAVKTSILSTRWKNLWKMNLVRMGTIEGAVIAISSFLIDFNDLYRFRNIWGIQFNFHRGNVLLASVSPNRKLHLDFSTTKQEFPRQFGWQLDLNCQRSVYLPPPPTFFIKTLHLVSVSYYTNEAVSSLVSNFHFLESLIIAKCNGLRSLRIVGSRMLGNLTVFDCPQLKSLHIKASKLHTFRYRGVLPWFSFEYYESSLADAMFDFRKGPGYRFVNHDFNVFLCGIRSAKNLTLCRWTFEKLIYPSLPQHRFYFLNILTVKELWWIDCLNDEELYDTDTLIYFLKFCPSLEILSVTIDPKSYQVLGTGTFFPEITRHTGLEKLRVVKLDGFRSQEDEISLAEKLKEVFSAEPKIVATASNGNSLRRLVKVTELEEEEGIDSAMEEKAEDMISKLPDEILFHIISLVPFDSAIQTIFLSSRWRLLWSMMALVQHGTAEDVASAVSGFLTNFNEHSPTRNTRKLRYHFDRGSVLMAIIAPNNKLHLDFSTGKQEFPRQFGLELELNHQNITHHQPTQSTFFVKTLNLISVNFLSNEAVSSVVSGFRFLENLKITDGNGLKSLCIDSNTKLQHLTIFDCPELKFLHISTPKLRTFRYRGLLPQVWPEFHYNLVDAMLDSRQGPGYIVSNTNELDPVLLTIKNTEILTVCRWIFEALICPSLSSLIAEFQFYNLKELWWIDNSNEGYNTDSLISFLKLCPALERLFITIDPESFCTARTAATCCSLQAGKRTQLKHLKLIKLEGFTNQEHETEFAERLQELATANPLILVTSDGFCWQSFVKVVSDQSKHQSKRQYKLVQEVRDTKELLLKHAHMGL